MDTLSRRDIVKYLGGLLPFGAIAAASALPAEAQQTPNADRDEEERAQLLIASVKPAVVLLEVEDQYGSAGWGSGFFVSEDGLVLTNRHVVQNAQKVTCLVRNRDKFTARVLKLDELYDLAVVKVDVPAPVATVRLGDSDAAKPGTLLAVTGYPQPGIMVWFGMALDSSTSRGSLNGLRYGGDANSFLGDRVLQIDAPVTGGNSGGPVFRLDTGEVIGVLSATIQDAGNLTVAVPISAAKILLSGLGLKLTVNVTRGSSPNAIVEPGDTRLLNTISSSKEVSRLFGRNWRLGRSYPDEAIQQAKRDWAESAGQTPPLYTPIVEQDGDLFFGSSDGQFLRWRAGDTVFADPFQTLVDTTSDAQIFLYPPEISGETLIAVSGALDLNGQIRARRDTLSLISGFLGLGRGSEERITIEGEGTIFGINRRSGAINWQVQSGFVATPVLHDGKVYYGGVGVRGCVEAIQGKEVYPQIRQKEGGRADWNYIGYAGKLGVFSVVVPMEGKRVGATISLLGRGETRIESHDPETGKVLWQKRLGKVDGRAYPLATAMYVDEAKQVLYALAMQTLVAIDIPSSSILWTFDPAKGLEKSKKQREKEASKNFSFTPGLVVHEGILYVGSTDKRLRAINGADGSALWDYAARGTVGVPAYHEGQILFGSRDKYLHVVDARTGELQWRIYTENPIRSQPLVHKGMIYAPTEGESLWSIRMPAV